ncbi:hypothetical protein CerSpe_153090 [Prunus speciosa]
MSCFKLPVSTCRSINGTLGNFWWGSSETGNKIHWRSWKHLCKSKKEGGMGFRELENFNLSLLAKHGWRMICNPDAF